MQYTVQSGKLVRKDLATGAQVNVASGIVSITVSTIGGRPAIRVTAEVRKMQQVLTLQL